MLNSRICLTGQGRSAALGRAKVVEGLTSYLAKRLAMAIFTIYIVD